MHPKNMTTDELLHEASACDGQSLMMTEALAYWLGKALENMQGVETALQGYIDLFGNSDDYATQWTVVLGYPDYLTDNYGQDVYRAQVSADTPKEAVYRARRDAFDDNPACEDPTDFALLALFQGWHEEVGYLA